MDELSQNWFELQDVRRRKFSNAVWIPLYGVRLPIKRGRYPEVGYVEEVLAVGTAVIFDGMRERAESLGWSSWSLDGSVPYLDEDGRYSKADTFHETADDRLGFRLVLNQYYNSLQPRQIRIHQDFVLAYGLLEEGDEWLRPSEGYEAVIRQTRNDEGEIIFVEVRAEYLKDYLAARKAALRLYYYRERQAVLGADPKYKWPEDRLLVSDEHDRCEVRCYEIDASGHAPGTTWGVFKTWRTDVDSEEDVPDFSLNDSETTESETTSGVWGEDGGRFVVSGEMWRGEWIEPAAKSCRIGYSEPEEIQMVQVDGMGGKVDLQSLNSETIGKYLWFRPGVMNELLTYRGANKTWYTRDTGGISPSPDDLLHFGVNDLGFINVYAYDIARRPLWERRIWVASNCRPDGGVSAELMQAQMQCQPAQTTAAENLLVEALSFLDSIFQEKFTTKLLREHHEVAELERKIFRFRGVDENGLRSLAKDIVKFSIERIDKKNLVNALGKKSSDKGTLKLLQELLTKYTDSDYAYQLMTPLFGVYELRTADAHLSQSDIDGCYSMLKVDRLAPFVQQAAQIIENVAEALGAAGSNLKEHAPDQ